jgi:uncharacterized BrkB/YihY/UPF0761 family membrane protein
VYDRPWYYQRLGLLASTLAMTVSLGFGLGLYYVIYCAIWALLSKLQRDNTLIGPV